MERHDTARERSDRGPAAFLLRGSSRPHLRLVMGLLVGLAVWFAAFLVYAVKDHERQTRTFEAVEEELAAATRSVSRLMVAAKEFQLSGNWLPLAGVLEQAIWPGASALRRYVAEGADRTSLRWEALPVAHQLARDVETSAAHALALYTHAMGLAKENLPGVVSSYPLSEEEKNSSAPQLVRRAMEIVGSQEFATACLHLSDLLDAFMVYVADDAALERRDFRWRVRLGAGGLLIVLLLALGFAALYSEMRRRFQEARARAIVELGERLSGVASVKDAARVLVEAADKLVGWDACGISLYNAHEDVVRDVLWIDEVDGRRTEVTDETRNRAPSPLIRRVLAGESVLASRRDELSGTEYRFGDTGRLSQSFIFVPIRRGSSVVGLLTLQSYQARAYTPEDQRLMEWLAARLGAAIERAELYEKLRESEQRYRLLVETSLIGVFVHDNQRFLFVSPACARIFGYDSPAEMIERATLWDVVAPEDRARMQRLSAERAAGLHHGEPYHWRGVRKDGRVIIVESLGVPMTFEDRQAILGTVRDVTDRELAQEQLQRTHRIYQQAISAAGAVPYRLEFATGRYEFPDRRIEELTGFSREELTWEIFASRVRDRHVIYPVVDPERLAELARMEKGLPPEEIEKRERLRKLTSGEANLYSAELLFERKDGTRVWIADSAVMETDPETGRVVGAFGILQDVTPRKRAQARAEVFADLGKRLPTAKTLHDSARIFAEEARKLFAFDSCSIVFYDATLDRVVSAYAEDLIEGRRQQVEGTATTSARARQVLGGEPLLILREDESEASDDLIAFGDTTRRSLSIMMAPVRHGDRVLGLVAFQSYSRNAFTSADLEDLCSLATYVGASFEQVRTLELLESSEEQLRAVWTSAPIGLRLTDAEGVVWLVNPAYCEIVELPEDAVVGQPFGVAYVADAREHVMAKYRERFSTGDIDSVLVREVVLWNGKKKTLQVLNRLLHTKDGTMLLSIVADRTREHELSRQLMQKQRELEELASYDSLTGVANRRFAFELVERELERARRYRTPICALMIDLDHFKQINDKYGHAAGDEVLRQFGAILKRNARSTDVVGRYGGEEFLIVMPETGLEGALIFAERVRRTVDQHHFEVKPDLVLHVTCSIGVAEGELDMLEADVLIARADQALYRAKAEGRNRVSVA